MQNLFSDLKNPYITIFIKILSFVQIYNSASYKLSYMLLHRIFEFIYKLYIRDRGISIEIYLEAQSANPLYQ